MCKMRDADFDYVNYLPNYLRQYSAYVNKTFFALGTYFESFCKGKLYRHFLFGDLHWNDKMQPDWAIFGRSW